MKDLGRIAIIGSGPTGLGAAWRLKELGHDDFTIYEASDIVGGLASSHVDKQGFTWDIGGHVQFSHYPYFDRVMDEVIPAGDWLRHERESWIWMRDRFIPYPFQYNLHRLPPDDVRRCLEGMRAARGSGDASRRDFGAWIAATFGKGVADIFMVPYNEKVWAHPLDRMSCDWMRERVAAPDIERVEKNVATGVDDKSWGPNNTFRFPRLGGTGAIWTAVAARIGRDRIRLGNGVRTVRAAEKTIVLADGAEERFDLLLNTAPLDIFAAMVDGLPTAAKEAAGRLSRSAVNIVGIGIDGRPSAALSGKCWIYFPEPEVPFHRVTVFSHYSPNNVPDPDRQWSLMTEVSESATRPVDRKTLADDVERACRETSLLSPADKVVSKWQYHAPYGYPTPTIDRDRILAEVQPRLEAMDLYSRGRFGGWKYEASNQDHSFMQGVEWAGRMHAGTPELTYAAPDAVNAGTPTPHPAGR
ncbi:MAG TPA: FAD-dependent oxidoreductase [Candidatus Eisenbacteria bacterium]|nr:FAD-dependent oxidoreductase [Candidatus Eisenbacteria bacterium]